MSCFKSLTSVSSLNPHNPKGSLTICCCCSGAKSCPTLCDPMNCSTPGFPVLYYLPEFAQTHVHLVGDAIQPSHPLVTPFSSCPQSFPALGSFPTSRLFKSGDESIRVPASASVLSMNIQGWFPLGLTDLISLHSKGLSSLLQHNSKSSILWHTAFFMAQLWPSYITTGKTIALTKQIFV